MNSNVSAILLRLVPLILLVAILPACGVTITPPPPVLLTVAGANSMQPLIRALTTAYNAQHPQVTFDIQGGGSQLGQTWVASARADIGLVAWSPPELGDELRLTPVARDAIAIILNTENQLVGLSIAELRDIFRGRLLNWSAVGGASLPIQVVSREAGSGTRAVFEAAVMAEQAVTPTAIVLPNSRAVVEFVAENPNAIAYVSFAFISEGVYGVPIEGVPPTQANLANSSYFLTRELALVTPQESRPEVEQFIAFTLSPAGQAIVAERWGRVR